MHEKDTANHSISKFGSFLSLLECTHTNSLNSETCSVSYRHLIQNITALQQINEILPKIIELYVDHNKANCHNST